MWLCVPVIGLCPFTLFALGTNFSITSFNAFVLCVCTACVCCLSVPSSCARCSPSGNQSSYRLISDNRLWPQLTLVVIWGRSMAKLLLGSAAEFLYEHLKAIVMTATLTIFMWPSSRKQFQLFLSSLLHAVLQTHFFLLAFFQLLKRLLHLQCIWPCSFRSCILQECFHINGKNKLRFFHCWSQWKLPTNSVLK